MMVALGSQGDSVAQQLIDFNVIFMFLAEHNVALFIEKGTNA